MRKRYTQAFKQDALSQVTERGSRLSRSPSDWGSRHRVCTSGPVNIRSTWGGQLNA